MSILSKYPDYEATIGIEVHVQLTTHSKIFCSCSNSRQDQPNVNINPVCSGQPGVLPVLNQEVVKAAIQAGLATNCTIAHVSSFARKHYFYPDLPKNYQITQSDNPICINGYIPIRLEDGSSKNIRLTRIHMEEDAGKNIHSNFSNESYVDLNRAGTPLLEVVSEPDISNAYEAKEYLKTLRLIAQYLGICTGNMEEGAFRADTNISVRKKGQTKLGTKCELKNINSFKFIADAIEYEIERQIKLLEAGQKVRQETRLWNVKKGETETMRSKEEAADYRYFIDPDLPLLKLSKETIDEHKKTLPLLPQQLFENLIHQGLTVYEADILVNDKDLAFFYLEAHTINPSKHLINWVLRDVIKLLKDEKISILESKVTPAHLAELLSLLDKGVINNRSAQEVFLLMAQSGQKPYEIVKDKGLEQVGNKEELEAFITEIIKNNPQQVQAYKNGQEKLFGFFVGQAMQKTKGKGDPQLINELLKKHLS